jgi:hypothetical protein
MLLSIDVVEVVHRAFSWNCLQLLSNFVQDEAAVSDYSIGKQFIYAAFAWSKAEDAYRIVFSLAEKHRLGLFNVSSDDQEVRLPSDRGLVLAHGRNKPGLVARHADAAPVTQEIAGV